MTDIAIEAAAER